MDLDVIRQKLSHLNEVNRENGVSILSVYDEEFKTYGRIVSGYDFSQWIAYMENNTDIPENGNQYIASVSEMEDMPATKDLQDFYYGGMPIQVGFCNGRNSTYNGFEYHKCSEINIAVTDFMLVLGHLWDVDNHTYDMTKAKVFFVPKGTALEMYQTTLHLSPCKTSDEGFKDIVVLQKGTNTPLERKPVSWKEEMRDTEDVLLLQKNKWVIAHEERKPLIDQGAYPGALGENRELKY